MPRTDASQRRSRQKGEGPVLPVQASTWRRHLTTGLGLAVFALVYVACAAYSASQTAASWDEPAHLAAGYAALTQRDYRDDPAHPPLLRMWAALPLAAMAEVSMTPRAADRTAPGDWLTAFYPFARRFLHRENDADRLLRAGRAMTHLLGVLLGVFVFLWARDWLGLRAAMLLLAAFALEPNLLAHSSVVTTDIGATCFVTGSLYFAWRLRHGGGRGAVAGVTACVALAMVSKFSAVLLVPVLGVLGVHAWRRGHATARQLAVLAAIVISATWATIWIVYGLRHAPSDAEGWMFSLSHPRVAASPLAGILAVIDDLRLLPNAYSYGLVDALTSTGGLQGYLLGEYSGEGWWYYFPFALAVKLPTALLALSLGGLALLVLRRARPGASDAAFVVVPIAGYLLAASASGINVGLRHVLPVVPLLLLAAGVGMMALLEAGRRRVALPVLALLALGWTAEFATAYPYPLTFFNAMAGGPGNGFHLLADSNLGWGQGLKSLRRWMDQRGVDHLSLAYFGQADPAYYKIPFTPLPSSGLSDHLENLTPPRLPGYVAISATTLTGVALPPWLRPLYAPFRTRTPDAVVANSIRVFWVDEWPVSDSVADVEPEGTVRLADALLFGSRWPGAAARYYERHLRTHPDDVGARARYATALVQLGRSAESVAVLEPAVALDTSGAVRLLLAQVLFAQGRLQDARPHAEAAVALRAGDPDAHHLLGRIGLAMRDPQAMVSFRQALALNPAHEPTRQVLAALDARSRGTSTQEWSSR